MVGLVKHPPTHSAPNFYSAQGWKNHSKVWMGSTTTTGGVWTIDYTSAGFSRPPNVLPTLQLEDVDVFDRGFASLSAAPTAINAAGYGVRGADLALLGPTVRTVPDGTIVHIIAFGD